MVSQVIEELQKSSPLAHESMICNSLPPTFLPQRRLFLSSMDTKPRRELCVPKMNYSVSTFFLVVLLLFAGKSAGKLCQNCGSAVVPYPMSTALDCGDPNYSIFCNSSSGQLYFSSTNGFRYPIMNIIPAAQKLMIRLLPVSSTPCYAADYAGGGIKLNSSGPFNLSADNTLMYFNCVPRLLGTPLNCTNSSLCWSYVRQVPEFESCRSMKICCTLRAGGSPTAFGVRLSNVSHCTAYQSFVGLDWSSPVQQWPQAGMELQWDLPKELQCSNQSDCDGAIPNSNCSADPFAPAGGIRRCFCDSGFRWDPTTGTCINLKEECYRPGICRIRRICLITGLTISAFVLLISMMTGFLLYKRHLKAKDARESLARKRQEMLSNSTGGRCAKLFSGKEIKIATNSFTEDNFLGSGGFGEVCKGTLKDGTVIAVKTAKIGNIKSTEQVLNEVQILSQVNHRHLLRLVGCCVELEQPMLVYEFASNGNLYEHLHGKYDFLNWKQRLTIAHQTAEALAYLHFSAYPPIYHRDIKSSNILLDEKLNAKVSDFGISRLVDTELSHISTCAQGTLGYMDPEYYRNFQLTDKSDVYSFGVLLLELLTSEKVVDFDRGMEEANLVVYVQKRANEGKLMEMVDKELKAGASNEVLETMRNFGFLAMGCLHDRRQDRPTMKEVTEELGYITSLYEVINAAATEEGNDSF